MNLLKWLGTRTLFRNTSESQSVPTMRRLRRMASNYADRQAIAQDTLNRVDTILQQTPEGSLDSEFISEQLPPLDESKNPHFPPTKVVVVNSDSFTAARNVRRRRKSVPPDPNLKETGGSEGKIAVLNLASDAYPAGGWLMSLSKTQEEALCYSSTLYPTLKEEYYPWPNLGPGSIAGVYSPSVVVFKDDLDHSCVDLPLEERLVVSVITVAAPRHPKLMDDGTKFRDPEDLECMRGKIRLVYRMAGHNGNTSLVLGAMGCGAYLCPPRQVAEEMRAILLEPEFKGWFRDIVFAVYTTPKGVNFGIFNEVFKNTEI